MNNVPTSWSTVILAKMEETLFPHLVTDAYIYIVCSNSVCYLLWSVFSGPSNVLKSIHFVKTGGFPDFAAEFKTFFKRFISVKKVIDWFVFNIIPHSTLFLFLSIGRSAFLRCTMQECRIHAYRHGSLFR